MAGITPYEELWDMPFDPKVCADERHVPRWFVNVAGRIVKVLIRILWRFKAYGLENLRSFEGKSGAIIAGNHSSFFRSRLRHPFCAL